MGRSYKCIFSENITDRPISGRINQILAAKVRKPTIQKLKNVKNWFYQQTSRERPQTPAAVPCWTGTCGTCTSVPKSLFCSKKRNKLDCISWAFQLQFKTLSKLDFTFQLLKNVGYACISDANYTILCNWKFTKMYLDWEKNRTLKVYFQ